MLGYKMIHLWLHSSYASLNIFVLDCNIAGFCILLFETRNKNLIHVYEEPILKVMPPDVNWKYVKSQSHQDIEQIKLKNLFWEQ